MRLITTLCVPNRPPERSSSFIGFCVCCRFARPCPVSPWNTLLWCFLAGLRLHTSFCSWVSDAIRRPRWWFALSRRPRVLPAAPPPWGGMVLWWRPVIQLSSSLYVETQTSGLLSCMLHHSHVPCALWPEWLPTEFLEAAWLGQKSNASWAVLSHGESCHSLDPVPVPFTMAAALTDPFIFPIASVTRTSLCGCLCAQDRQLTGNS